MKKILILAVVTLGLFTMTAQEKREFKTEKEKASYAYGLYLARNLKQVPFELDPALIAEGVKEGAAGKGSFAENEIMDILNGYAESASKAASGPAKKAGEDFLAANKKQEGVKTMPVVVKGKTYEMQYQVITEGKGAKPKKTDSVTTHYKGTLIDGKQFDSSYDRNEPAQFGVDQVIPGWTAALQEMKVGSKWKLWIPSDAAYGDSGRPPQIPGGSTLVFEVELISIP